MSLTKLILRFAAPVPKIREFEHYLFIGPHPDDIEIGAGATVSRLVSLGKKVSFLICLDGRFGFENAPEGTTPDEMASIRRKESIEAAKVLGVTDVRFLELSDGGLYSKADLYDGMMRVVGEVGADIIFAPDPDTGAECHEDHLNVGNCAKNIAFFAPFKDITGAHGAKPCDVRAIGFYMTAKPNRYLGTSKVHRLKQIESILRHQSQYPAGCEAFKGIKTYLALRSIDFGLRSFKGRAEGFRILGRTQMHCLPEAGR
ncbi:MAG: PIG-L family deacetylase [Lachnospiraceae bacterium]|nr:PIG-L family deacetylase [Lachnospiraceae bacterium]